VSTTTRTASSERAAANDERNSRTTSHDNAFRRSGRLIVIVATRPSTEYKTSAASTKPILQVSVAPSAPRRPAEWALVYVLIAIGVGVGLGFALGGRLRGVGEAELRWMPVLAVGAILQAVAIPLSGALGVGFVLASYATLIAFAAANIHLAGMGVVLIGVAMNFGVIAINGGMPVRARAIEAAGIARGDREIRALHFTSKRHLERPSDKLMPLADVLPLPLPGPSGQVLSFGDLAMSIGVADFIVHAMRRVRKRERGRSATPGEEPDEPDEPISSPEPEASASTGTD
jgi:hypothetical protein